ncbi:hypothetical protein [Abyssalbus ytuae]|uniref:Uncharacterized protein n=1 Tax=Abyssalbus ytuae TaxID=2926907 RepID=A0A9E7A2I7_9FLAO|nr:hypothetical protein [Abyssalbus ytuae]UOB18591.1 hypothetical protein MQE35_04705 [Abyssalbus ytuae]
MGKVVYDKIDIVIPVGETNFNDFLRLRDGQCIGVKIIPISGTEYSHAINVGVEDSQGNEIISTVDFRDYTNNAGGYKAGLKPVQFDARGNITIIGQSTQAIALANFVAQLIFAIDTEPKC